MQSILEEFAYNNLALRPRLSEHSPEYREAVGVLSRNAERLCAMLNADQRSLFEKYVETQGEVNRLTEVGTLLHGYRLGLVMASEAFVGLEALIDNGLQD